MRKKNLLTLVLLLFNLQAKCLDIKFPENFLWGIANAPAHVEDKLNDIWLEHANKNKIFAYKDIPQASSRIFFWSDPDSEIELASQLGVKVFRMGVDWGRVEPEKGKFSDNAIKRYREILKKIKAKNMKVMLSLFHHSEPKWTLEKGSWKNPEMIEHFTSFSRFVLSELSEQIDYLITFNEAQVYSVLSEITAMWPSHTGEKNTIGFLGGTFTKMLEHISRAHTSVYQMSKKMKIPTSIAHNIAYYRPSNFLLSPIARFMAYKMNEQLLDLIGDNLDFIGLNYYGSETIGLRGILFDDDIVYSDSGRGIDPMGLYKMIHKIKDRYNNSIPIFITENGIADSEDSLRSAYLSQHLKVISQLISEGVNIIGYIHWTLSDNWEWADGYCPKFGLVEVLRDQEKITKKPRASFFDYQEIIRSNNVPDSLSLRAWESYKKRASSGSLQFFCRDTDGQTPLERAVSRKLLYKDWRFILN